MKISPVAVALAVTGIAIALGGGRRKAQASEPSVVPTPGGPPDPSDPGTEDEDLVVAAACNAAAKAEYEENFLYLDIELVDDIYEQMWEEFEDGEEDSLVLAGIGMDTVLEGCDFGAVVSSFGLNEDDEFSAENIESGEISSELAVIWISVLHLAEKVVEGVHWTVEEPVASDESEECPYGYEEATEDGLCCPIGYSYDEESGLCVLFEGSVGELAPEDQDPGIVFQANPIE